MRRSGDRGCHWVPSLVDSSCAVSLLPRQWLLPPSLQCPAPAGTAAGRPPQLAAPWEGAARDGARSPSGWGQGCVGTGWQTTPVLSAGGAACRRGAGSVRRLPSRLAPAQKRGVGAREKRKRRPVPPVRQARGVLWEKTQLCLAVSTYEIALFSIFGGEISTRVQSLANYKLYYE